MNRAVIIVATLATLLLVGGGYFFLKLITPGPASTNSNTTPPGSVDVPYIPYGSTGSSGQNTSGPHASVVLRTGETVQVNIFKNAEETKEDKNNPGHYYLAGTNTVTAPYTILYTEKDQSFNITLFEEPIAATRNQAEQKLLNILGINQEDACYLHYWVGVPYGINPVYAGKNLGFSFCPGATEL